MTGGAFLNKKHKKLMAARRKKKRLAQQGEKMDHHEDMMDSDNNKEVTAVAVMVDGKTSATAATASATTRTLDRPAKRQKTTSPQPNSVGVVSSSSSSSTSTSSAAAAAASDKDMDDDNDIIQRVVIPSNVTAKEAKKLRKEARRNARSEGLTEPEKKLVFVNEHGQVQQGQDDEQDEPPSAASASAESRPKASSSSKKHPGNKKRKEFPRINDILEQERKKAQVLARKEALQATEAALPVAIKNRYVALDCEMVGTGIHGKISVLARVSLTDWQGQVLLDTFVQVPTRVTDFRTQWSGVTPGKIQAHNNAMAVEACRKKVAELIKGKILVGHALKNDLDALILTHPKDDIRDTSKYRSYQRLFNKKWRPRKLRDLVLEHLGLVIQTGKDGHDSVDDARAAMELFKLSRETWEKDVASKRQKRQRQK